MEEKLRLILTKQQFEYLERVILRVTLQNEWAQPTDRDIHGELLDQMLWARHGDPKKEQYGRVQCTIISGAIEIY
jgi:hypothetical protein